MSKLDDLNKSDHHLASQIEDIECKLSGQLENIDLKLNTTINQIADLDLKIQILQQQLSNYSLALQKENSECQTAFEARYQRFRNLPDASQSTSHSKTYGCIR